MATEHDASRLTAALTELVSAVTRVATAVGELDTGRPEFATARTLGISPRTLRRLVAEGEVAGYAIGREVHVRTVDWDSYVARQAIAPKASKRAGKVRELPKAGAPKAPANAADDFAALTAGAAQ